MNNAKMNPTKIFIREIILLGIPSVPVYFSCCCSFVKLCLTFCDPMDYSMPAFPVPHYYPEFAQIHIH